MKILKTTLAISPDQLQPCVAGKHYSQSIHVTGGEQLESLEVSKGKLPKGLTLTTNTKGGTIAGLCEETKSEINFTLKAVDVDGNVAEKKY